MKMMFNERAAKTQALFCTALMMLVGSHAAGEAVWEEDPAAIGGYREIIRMTVTPAGEPSPAFKYRLSLRPHELVPGNSVAHYMRAFPEGGIERTWKRVRDEFGEEADNWYGTDMPISQLPLDKVREAAMLFQGLIDNHLRPGTKCRETDWGVSFVDVSGPEIISFLLPEIQAMRSIGRAVALRTRLPIAERRYDDAIELLRMNYRLGRDVGEQPILVSNLVGIAICGITNTGTIDLIAAPNSPNLYWALSELPRPMISLRDSMRLELAIGPRMFELLDSPEEKERTPAEWNAILARDIRSLAESGLHIAPPNRADAPAVRFAPLLVGLVGYSHAKDRLIEWGYDKDEVEAMAVGQVMAIYSARVYQTAADELEKTIYVDFESGKRLGREANERVSNLRWGSNSVDQEFLPIAQLLLPAVQAAYPAQYRVERDIDALRVIEALRMHAAENDCQWPASLEEVTCVPVPKNPATEEPFEYYLEGDTAVLVLPHSDGMHIERRFELTIVQ